MPGPSWCRVSGLEFSVCPWDSGFMFRVVRFGFYVSGFRFWVGFMFRVMQIGFCYSGSSVWFCVSGFRVCFGS